MDRPEVSNVSSHTTLVRQILMVGVLVYTLLLFLALFSGFFYIRLILAALSFSFLLFFACFSNDFKLPHIIYVLFIFLMGLAALDRSGGSSLIAALFLTGGLAMAVVIRDFNLGDVAYKFPLLGYLLYLYFCWLVLGYGSGEFNQIFSGYSRNIVGAVVLALLGGYLWICYEKDVRPSILIVISSALITIPLYGRSNIVALMLVVFCVLFFCWKFKFSLFCFCASVMAAIVLGPVVADYLSSETNFSSGIESPRYEMLLGYLGELNLFSLLLGGDEKLVLAIQEYGGNPHNAFIRFHSNFGFMLFVSLVVIFLVFIRLLASSSGFLLVLLCVMLFRGFFDVIFFGNLIDYALLGPMAYFYRPEYKSLIFSKT